MARGFGLLFPHFSRVSLFSKLHLLLFAFYSRHPDPARCSVPPPFYILQLSWISLQLSPVLPIMGSDWGGGTGRLCACVCVSQSYILNSNRDAKKHGLYDPGMFTPELCVLAHAWCQTQVVFLGILP